MIGISAGQRFGNNSWSFEIDQRGVDEFVNLADEHLEKLATDIADESKVQAPQSGNARETRNAKGQFVAKKGYGPLVEEIGVKKGKKKNHYLVIADAFYSAWVHWGHSTKSGGQTRKNEYVSRAAQIVGGRQGW